VLWLALVEHHAALHPAFALRARDRAPWSAAVRARLADPAASLWVAAQPGGAVEGFCVGEIEASRGPLSEARRGAITELAVRPALRRRGVATRLVDAVLSWFRTEAVARVEVRVLVRNRSAQGFWRARGFGPFVDVLERRL